MTTQFTEGGVTVTLDDGLADWVRGLLSAAESETVRVLEEEAGAIADRARAAWYGPDGVHRGTGRSGDIEVVTMFDRSAGEVRVSVGSTDTRQEKGKSGVVPYFVHRPGPFSTVDKRVTRDEWWAAKKAGKPVRMFGPPGKRTYIVEEPNPRASDGKYLLVELVRKPMQARVRVIAPDIARAIAARAGG